MLEKKNFQQKARFKKKMRRFLKSEKDPKGMLQTELQRKKPIALNGERKRQILGAGKLSKHTHTHTQENITKHDCFI